MRMDEYQTWLESQFLDDDAAIEETPHAEAVGS